MFISSFIRTKPSALGSHQISLRSRARRLAPHYRRWGITPRPEDLFSCYVTALASSVTSGNSKNSVPTKKNPAVKTAGRKYANACSSFIRTIPSALESNQISLRSRARRLAPHYRRWGITPRPEDNYLFLFIIAPDLQFVKRHPDIVSVYSCR